MITLRRSRSYVGLAVACNMVGATERKTVDSTVGLRVGRVVTALLVGRDVGSIVGYIVGIEGAKLLFYLESE